MVRLANERILLVSDPQRTVHDELHKAAPGAQIVSVGDVFEGIAELSANRYTTVIAGVEPMARRPEAAVKTLRELAANARLLLFSEAPYEPIARRMLEFGCDDYIVTPANAVELSQIFGVPPLRIAPETTETQATESTSIEFQPASSRFAVLDSMALSDILLDALIQHPHDAPQAAVTQIDAQLAPTMSLSFLPKEEPSPTAPEGLMTLSLPIRANNDDVGMLHLMMPRDEDEVSARHFLSQLALLMGKLSGLQDRHNLLQKLATTDDLTGLYNGRYFRLFLNKILDKAREKLFPVTLLLFDIDNFKKYNDQYGHGTGDQILKQTAMLMKRCVRDHDLVARISGDEFAVVFWEKDSHRQPRDPSHGTPGRPPQSVMQICQRFQRLMSTPDFTVIGPMGQGTLSISGGLAVFPYAAQTADELYDAADRALMFGAKTSGKNSIYLIGEGQPQQPAQ